MTDRVILKWTVPVDDQEHKIGGGQVVHVACQYQSRSGEVQVWTIEPRSRELAEARRRRTVQVIGTGHPMSFSAEHLGTALAANGELVWHVVELWGEQATEEKTDG